LFVCDLKIWSCALIHLSCVCVFVGVEARRRNGYMPGGQRIGGGASNGKDARRGQAAVGM